MRVHTQSIPTRGRTLDYAAVVYDFLEPILLLGKQAEYDHHIVSLLELHQEDRVLDLGCGEGELLAFLQSYKAVNGYGLDVDPDNICVCLDKGVNVIETCIC